MVQDMTIQEMTMQPLWDIIQDEDASLHDNMGNNFILNTASIAFHYIKR